MRPYRGRHKKIAHLALDASVVLPLPDGVTMAQHQRAVANAITHCARTRHIRLRMKTNTRRNIITVTRVMPLDEVLVRLGI